MCSITSHSWISHDSRFRLLLLPQTPVTNQQFVWIMSHIRISYVTRINESRHNAGFCSRRQTLVTNWQLLQRGARFLLSTSPIAVRPACCTWAAGATRVAGMISKSKATYIYEKRGTKSTCNRDLYTCKETYRRDLQKRPIKPACCTWAAGPGLQEWQICQETPTYMNKDLQKKPATGSYIYGKRPTKETCTYVKRHPHIWKETHKRNLRQGSIHMKRDPQRRPTTLRVAPELLALLGLQVWHMSKETCKYVKRDL